jgi:hypothetical protein
MRDSVPDSFILWRRLDQPGHEAARLVFHDPFWQLMGTAVFAHDRHPCRVEYLIVCDASWRTLHARVSGWMGSQYAKVELLASATGEWRRNGKGCTDVTGCVDLDLSFSPSTNLIPIRRLRLAPGEEAEARAAWVQFPGFTLEPLAQRYRRTGESSYRYETLDGSFASNLEVNEMGFVTRYPGQWEIEPASRFSSQEVVAWRPNESSPS